VKVITYEWDGDTFVEKRTEEDVEVDILAFSADSLEIRRVCVHPWGCVQVFLKERGTP
jgi:hypothetical protein